MSSPTFERFGYDRVLRVLTFRLFVCFAPFFRAQQKQTLEQIQEAAIVINETGDLFDRLLFF
jgi:hypothetical protein